MAWSSLCELSELKEGQGKYVEVAGFQIALFLHEGKPYAIDNRCPHANGSLAGGWIENGCAVCPWHQWAFNLQTGQMRIASRITISTYPTRVLQRPDQPDLVQADLPLYVRANRPRQE